MYMGKRVSRRMLRAVRRLCGHEELGPTGVLSQAMERMSAPISPPPSSHAACGVTGGALSPQIPMLFLADRRKN
jgi:hypothetical protein